MKTVNRFFLLAFLFGLSAWGQIGAPAYPQPTIYSCIDAGSTDAYACTLSPSISSYRTGALYRFKAATANTGAATIAFSGLTATPIKKLAGGITTALADDDIRAGQWVQLVYDGTNMQMVSPIGNVPAVTGGSCTNQAATAISSLGVPTCTTLTSAYVNSSIAQTGTDINSSHQVTATHIALTVSSALNFGSIEGGTCADLTLTLTGAAVGDNVAAALPAAVTAQSGYQCTMAVSATDTVQVRCCNWSGAAVDLASATFGAKIIR